MQIVIKVGDNTTHDALCFREHVNNTRDKNDDSILNICHPRLWLLSLRVPVEDKLSHRGVRNITSKLRCQHHGLNLDDILLTLCKEVKYRIK